MQASIDVVVRDTVFDPANPSSRVAVFREEEGRALYKVWLYLEGRALPFVESVTYQLHSTFPDPVRTVPRTPSNPNCQLEIWTWGLFEVQVTVVDKSRRTYALSHRMSYDSELKQEGVEYRREEADPRQSMRPRRTPR